MKHFPLYLIMLTLALLMPGSLVASDGNTDVTIPNEIIILHQDRPAGRPNAPSLIFKVSENGELSLRCDKLVEISGTNVDGGSLTVKGEKVVLSGGFSVEAGGRLSINGK